MKLSNFLVLNAIVALVFAAGLLLIPGTMATFYGMTPSPSTELLARFFGTELLAVGLVCWLARNLSDKGTQGALILGFLIADAVGLVVSLMGTMAGTFNALGWSAVVIYLVLAAGYAYFQFMPPQSA